MKHRSGRSHVVLLLTITAVIEAAAGVALLVAPALTASLLVGGTLDTPTGSAVGRVAGAALIGLGVACWRARHDESSGAATGVVAAMLSYNLAAVAILAYAGLGEGAAGILLWPAVILHAVQAGWCIVCLRAQSGLDQG
jgi:hypothetical protein